MTKNNNSFSSEGKAIIDTKRPSKIEQLLSLIPLNFLSNKPVIAVLRLEGVIGKSVNMKSGLTSACLNKLIEKVFKTDRLVALCLVINSPGGSPVQSELIASRITSLAKKNQIPVYSFVEDVAASGGYWIACAGDKIYASKSSIIGSIGVVSSGFGFHEAIHKLGVERRVYTEGKAKSILDPFQPTKDTDIKILKHIQKNIYDHFTSTIKHRRAGRLTQADDILFTGEFWDGQTALDYGLIDGIDDLYSFIYKHYGDDIKIELIENKQSWFQKKFSFGATKAEIDDLPNQLIGILEQKMIQSKFDLY